MSDTQLAMFPAAHSRRSDPETSRAAAATVDVNRRCTEVLDALRAKGGKAIPSDLVDLLRPQWKHVQQNSVCSRLNTLAGKGLVRKTGISRPGPCGPSQQEWEIA